MKGYQTSFSGMFQTGTDGMPSVDRVEIPLIQRDYAQGRQNDAVQVIRHDFLAVLIRAVAGGPPVDLDFVYGEVNDGTLRPLDGQQRLTTLFLLHWYLAAKTGRLGEASSWLKFSYATRPSAELFCRQLVKPEHHPSFGELRPSAWIQDQAWYLYAWRHDPSVQSMLVMLDAIDFRLSGEGVDLQAAWQRITESAKPAISFHFLPIEDMPSGEELYIKMNSRGKPLTEFETFKARFEQILEETMPQGRFDELIHKLDGPWTDVLWRYHGGDYVVDDEFMRYLEFIIEICEWRDGVVGGSDRLLDRAQRVFASDNSNGERNVAFLFHAFDTWESTDIGEVFASHFQKEGQTQNARGSRVTLFESRSVNLFEECCRRYGQMNGNARLFTLSETLLLFAILIHRQFETDDFQERLRVLRNLTDLADEVRENRIIELVGSVEKFIRNGEISHLGGFNPDRVEDEEYKRSFLQEHPEQGPALRRLEDHHLLRGRLFAFELDSQNFSQRAFAFDSITSKGYWLRLTGALLAKGDYGHAIAGGRGHQLGSKENESRWREVFTRRGRNRNEALRTALGELLDSVAQTESGATEALEAVSSSFSRERLQERTLDWRYYLVTYAAMREGDTGIYYGEHFRESRRWEYSMCMLRTMSITGGAWYRDPYLLSAWRESGVGDAVLNPWFRGYENEPRWLRLKRSDAGIRCVAGGFELAAPLEEKGAEKFRQVCHKFGATSTEFLPVNQAAHGERLIDSEDRVQKCAAFIQELVDAGL
ncbi:DUF262 domain-containing protein [Nesterenkonia halotolerans]|uniref:DUF262 domain-containing protein n=1 Tax=Nesterenkonia halotolerans TaxID=225325 RepID=UPI003EE5C69C